MNAARILRGYTIVLYYLQHIQHQVFGLNPSCAFVA